MEPTKIKIYFSYAHEDRRLRDKLDKHLGSLKLSNRIITCYDRTIEAGTFLKNEIDNHLNTSDIILLLISPDFINSEYCSSRELLLALKRHEAGEARVIPIFLRPVDWEDLPFSTLKPLPAGKAITLRKDQDAAFMEVAKGIRKVVHTLRQRQEASHLPIPKPSPPTIDTQEAVKLFHKLMQSNVEDQLRVMYLVGEANMGKSHMLNKVFPALARKYDAVCVQFDLRDPICTIPDILNMACKQLGTINCSNYYILWQKNNKSHKIRRKCFTKLNKFCAPKYH